MTITTFSTREFEQHASEAKKAANNGPVFITDTDQGNPAHVLLTINEYRRITGEQKNIAELLWMPGIEDVDLQISRSDDLAKVAIEDIEAALHELRKTQGWALSELTFTINALREAVRTLK